MDEFPKEELYDSIRHLYSRKDVYSKILAMIVNGSISSCKTKFILSKNTILHHLEADPNMDIRSLRGEQYSYVRNMLKSTQSIKVLRDSDPFTARKKGEKRIMAGGVYEIIAPDILTEIERNKARFK